MSEQMPELGWTTDGRVSRVLDGDDVQLVAALVTIGGVARIASNAEQPREQSKWERMTGKPCRPHDRTGAPTSPPPPRRRGQ